MQIPLEIGPHVPVEPDRSIPVVGQVHGRNRKPAAASETAPVLSLVRLGLHQVEPAPVLSLQQLLPYAAPTRSHLFAARHRPESQIACPARQRLGHVAHESQVRRAGEEEPTRCTVPIDFPLHRVKQGRLALDLVQCHRLGATHQSVGIPAGQVEDVKIIKRAEAPTRRQFPSQGALAGLARSGHHHRGHHPEAFRETLLDKTRKHRVLHRSYDNHSWRE